MALHLCSLTCGSISATKGEWQGEESVNVGVWNTEVRKKQVDLAAAE